MKLLLQNVKQLLANDEMERCDVLVEDGIVQQIAPQIDSTADETIDCNGHLILPGLVDVHIHLREPGGEYKETIVTGTKAAAKGGFTTVCAMPNTNPVPDNVKTMEQLQEKLNKDAVVRVLPYAAITKGLQGNDLTPMEDLAEFNIFAFTDDGVGIQTADMMYRAMKEAVRVEKPIVAHCEDNSIVYGGVAHDGEISKRLKLPGLPSLSESVQIARDVLLAEATGCHYHVCHVSTKESVRVIRDAKKAGIPVTAEVTPHHLLLNEEYIQEDDANLKMNPPLRSKEDQQALVEGLMDGTIDFIATDHAPHAESEKEVGFRDAPFGIVGLETAFPLLYTYFIQQHNLSLKQLVDWLTIKPAEAFDLPYGRLQEGCAADITLIDLQTEKEINKETFASKGKNTPFHNWTAKGYPVLTIVNGKVVFKEDMNG
ncbi:dihydroorotase [Oceanobacillus halotolerans]|uniref:dihydroorotase n=1 Tax=Oceanobacillus halotolerans TaxID=2663380 RepID=UPI0013D902F9|nr:dihydroorotase [Oceanobacillus halotolerans]